MVSDNVLVRVAALLETPLHCEMWLYNHDEVAIINAFFVLVVVAWRGHGGAGN